MIFFSGTIECGTQDFLKSFCFFEVFLWCLCSFRFRAHGCNHGNKIHDYEITCIFKLSRQATLNTEAAQPQPRNKKVFDIPKRPPIPQWPQKFRCDPKEKVFWRKLLEFFFKKNFILWNLFFASYKNAGVTPQCKTLIVCLLKRKKKRLHHQQFSLLIFACFQNFSSLKAYMPKVMLLSSNKTKTHTSLWRIPATL